MDPTYLGILNTKTIAYVGFVILGIFLLALIAIGLIELFKGGDFLAIGMTAVGGAIVLILAYIIIYSVANAYTTVTNSTEPDMNMMSSISTTPMISNIQLCLYTPESCIDLSNSTKVYLYWEVPGGIGCCNTFNCDYELFKSFCGTPYTAFRLYDIFIDGEIYKFNDMPTWKYRCTYDIPYNYIYEDFSEGYHNITILQKDCQDNIVDTKEILFNINNLGGGMYGLKRA